MKPNELLKWIGLMRISLSLSVIFRVYCADHTYCTLRQPVNATAETIKQNAADKLGLRHEDLVLAEVKSNGKLICKRALFLLVSNVSIRNTSRLPLSFKTVSAYHWSVCWEYFIYNICCVSRRWEICFQRWWSQRADQFNHQWTNFCLTERSSRRYGTFKCKLICSITITQHLWSHVWSQITCR